MIEYRLSKYVKYLECGLGSTCLVATFSTPDISNNLISISHFEYDVRNNEKVELINDLKSFLQIL